MLLSTLKFVIKTSRPLSTHLHSPKVIGTGTAVKQRNKYWNIKGQAPRPPPLPHPGTFPTWYQVAQNSKNAICYGSSLQGSKDRAGPVRD